MLDELPQLVWEADVDGRHVYFNRRWYEFTGMDEAESIGFGFLDALHPGDRDRALQCWRRGSHDGEAYEIEYRLYSRSRRTYRWFLGHARPVRDADGGVIRWLGTCTDVEPHKRAEQQVRERTAELEASWEHQLAIAELGLFALRTRDSDELAQEVVGHATAVLGVSSCEILELRADGEAFSAKAACGACAADVGAVAVPNDPDRLPGYTLASQAPVVFEDLRTETRFRPSDRLRDHGVVSGVSAVVHGSDGPYGVFAVHSTGERTFHAHEVHFVQAVANLLGESVRRIGKEQEANELGERLTTTLESITDAFFTLDRTWAFSYMNAHAERVLRSSREEVLGRSLWEAFPGAVGTTFEREYRRAVRERVPVRFEAYFTPLGAWFDVTAYPSSDGLAVYFRDVTDRKGVQERMELYRTFHSTLALVIQESLRGELDERFYRRVLDAAVRLVPGAQAGSLLHRDDDGAWSFRAVVGFDERLLDLRLPDAQIVAGRELREPSIVTGFDPAPLDDSIREVLHGPIGRADELLSTLIVPIWLGDDVRALLHLDNFETEAAFTPDAVELGRVFARQIGSVIQRMDLERDLVHQAHTDVVTGVPNRREAEHLLVRLLEEDRPGALLFLDIDEFKHVNEAYGHDMGDEVLRHVAWRIQAVLQDDAVLARWGGDEFLAMIPGIADPDAAQRAARAIRDALRDPFTVRDAVVVMSASIGIVLFSEGARSVRRSVLEADIALANAKRRGKDQVVLFTEEMGVQASRRFMIEEGLRRALAEDDERLTLHYQPRVDLRTGRVEAVEALSRWMHPDLGPVSPTEFVPIAEAARLIHPLTRRVMDRACRQARAWHDAGTPRVVSINLSTENMRRPGIVDDVREALERHEVPAGLLELEVTEGAAMTAVEEAADRLGQLRGLGTTIAIDDFGTAYSSLSYLKLLPVDTLKIDKSFLLELPEEGVEGSPDAALLRGIVALGRSLGLFVVAEGVETASQAAFLTELGCHGAQGNYFGEAVPAEAFRDRGAAAEDR